MKSLCPPVRRMAYQFLSLPIEFSYRLNYTALEELARYDKLWISVCV